MRKAVIAAVLGLMALSARSYALDGTSWQRLSYESKGSIIIGYIQGVISICDKETAKNNILCPLILGGKTNIDNSVLAITTIYSEDKYKDLTWEQVFPGAIAVGSNNLSMKEALHVLDGFVEKRKKSQIKQHKNMVDNLLN